MEEVLPRPQIAIIDYGLGNLFSIKQACSLSGMDAVITDSPSIIESSSAMILPGVGAFGKAMASLESKQLVPVILDFARSGRATLAICLGMQLLMDRSYEFGVSNGLGLISGEVLPLAAANHGGGVRVPQVGCREVNCPVGGTWNGTVLQGIASGAQMYFAHSFFVRPDDNIRIMAVTTYNALQFCSAVRSGNVWGLQFHPERSGRNGLMVYKNFSQLIHQGA